jgi:hypothetical protein
VRILRKSAHDSKTTERKTFLPPEDLIFFSATVAGGYKMNSETTRRNKRRSANAAALWEDALTQSTVTESARPTSSVGC